MTAGAASRPDDPGAGDTPAVRHERLAALFLAACELEGEARSRYLDGACADDPGLRNELEALLAEDTGPSSFTRPLLGTPIAMLAGAASTEGGAPERIGSYAILGVLGHGGMGTVYRARQASPDRVVALKVIRPGLATPSLVRRFVVEGHLLGRLNHRGIAQVHEVGSFDAGHGAQPFIAMELVDGLPLLRHADEARLDRAARLELVAQVCDAVHHAHQQGVVHRDLKPANILVDAHGQPKVLDFGIARFTGADLGVTAAETNTGELVGTLRYMSPEQAAGRTAAIDARSDVYALGAIAYELLTGRLPIETDSLSALEAARAICEAPPTRLRTIDPALRGDVETIIDKALEKDPNRRYESAAALADDLRRLVENRPILARPPSAAYLARTFARRHRALVAGTAVAFALLVVAVVGTSIGLVEAMRQRDEARRALDRAEAVRQFFIGVLTTPVPGAAGRDATVIESLQFVQRQLDEQFADDPAIRADVHEELSVTFHKLGRPGDAEPHARAALTIREETLGAPHRDTVRAMNNLAIILGPITLDDGAPDPEPDALMARAIDLHRTHRPEDLDLLVSMLSTQASIRFKYGDLEGSRACLDQAIAILASRSDVDAATIVTLETNRAVLLGRQGRVDEAIKALESLIEKADRLEGPKGATAIATRRLRAQVLRTADRHAEAAAAIEALLPIMDKADGTIDRAGIEERNNLAFSLLACDRPEAAETVYREALRRADAALDPSDILRAVMLDGLAGALGAQGRHDEAAAHFLDAETIVGAQGDGPASTSALRLAYKRADALLRAGRTDEARALCEERRALAAERGADDPLPVAHLEAALARAHFAAGDIERAREFATRSAEAYAAHPQPDLVRGDAIERLAEACAAAGLDELAGSLRAAAGSP